jgi:hypothetical protein
VLSKGVRHEIYHLALVSRGHLVELQSDFERICEQYLLGELTESECQRVEESYFADDSLFERFLGVKDDIVDAYARGDLTGNKRKRFEQHYLASKARRQRVEEARDLIQVASSTPTRTPIVQIKSSKVSKSERLSWWQLFAKSHPVVWRTGLVAAALILMAGSYLVVRQIQDRAAQRSPGEQARNAPKPQESANGNAPQTPAPSADAGGERAVPSPSPSTTASPESAAKLPRPASAQIASLTLLPFSAREPGSTNSLMLSQEQRVVRLNLVFGDAAYDSFQVSVHTVDGQQVIRRGSLKPSTNETGKTVTLTFDASLLNRQDYIATLSGRRKNGNPETIADYYFRVQRTAPQSPGTPPKK